MTEIRHQDAFPPFDLERIAFPETEHYDLAHGQATAKMAKFILEGWGDEHNTVTNHRALWAAALFHDLGRREPWNREDPAHARHSAECFERVIRADPVLWHEEALRETAARLIANHDRAPEPGNPLAVALHDADALEAARICPGTPEGLVHFRARTAGLLTPWVREPDKLRRYMESRGW